CFKSLIWSFKSLICQLNSRFSFSKARFSAINLLKSSYATLFSYFNFLFSCARSVFNKFFKWLFIFSLSRAALTSFLLSVSETTTFSVGLFYVFILGLLNQLFFPVCPSSFFIFFLPFDLISIY